MLSFSDLVSEDALNTTRTDFEEETVSVMKDFSEEIPQSDYRLQKKLEEIKARKNEKIKNTSKTQTYLEGLQGLFLYILKSLKVSAKNIIFGALVSIIWSFLQLRKYLIRENIELMERAKFENKPGNDRLRSYFRVRWNKSIGKVDFLAPVITMAIFYQISPKFYNGVFELYGEGTREYMNSNSKYSAFKKVYKTAYNKE